MDYSVRKSFKGLLSKFFASFFVLLSLTVFVGGCEKLDEKTLNDFSNDIGCELCVAIASPKGNSLTFLRGVPIIIDTDVTFKEVKSDIDLNFYYQAQGGNIELPISSQSDILNSLSLDSSSSRVSSDSFTPQEAFLSR